MKEQLELPIREQLRKRLLQLPDFVGDFIYELETSNEIKTRFEYSKDISLFFEFLLRSGKCSCEDVNEILPSDLARLKKRDLIDFFDYLSSYSKAYSSTKEKDVVQKFSNSVVGKARKLATLRKLFGYMLSEKLITTDITRDVDIKVPVKVKINNRLSAEEVQRFFATILEDVNVDNSHQKRFHDKVKFRDYVMSLILAYTGLRVSELVQLDIADIYLEKQTLKVTRKGGDEQQLFLPDRVVEDIREYIVYRETVKGVAKDHQQALFLSLQKKRIDDKTVRQMLSKYQKRAEIETKITPHVFRRTFGTNHYNTYQDMYLTAEVLGHSSAETTRRSYADPDKDRVQKSMQQFDYEKKNSENQGKLTKLAKKLGISVEELLEELG